MNTLKILFPLSKARVVVLLLITLAAGTANTALLTIINSAITNKGDWQRQIPLFLAVFAAYIVAERISQRGLIRLSERFLLNIRTALIEKLLRGNYAAISGIGEERILACLTTDASAISKSGSIIFTLLISSIKLISALIYLAYSSMQAFLWTLLVVSIGVSIYTGIAYGVQLYLKRASKTEEVFLKHVRNLILGVKELKLNQKRRSDFFVKDIRETCSAVEKDNNLAKGRYVDAGLFGDGVFFLLIGAVAILFTPVFGLENRITSIFLITLMYLIGPLTTILANYPSLHMMYISVKRIESLYEVLSENREASCELENHKRPASLFSNNWREIELVDVNYEYKNNGDLFAFQLGPINLSIRAGELVFIVGGNGSGKSTLGKIITGLYVSPKGKVTVDGKSVDSSNLDDYRQLFGAVFSDYHIFPQLYGVNMDKVAASSAETLRYLGLEKKVDISQGQLDPTKLSQGEKKRLALANCFFEDRSIYFFDEWAADQDATFKKIFYTVLLPSLKDAGSTIIAITHDDRYFHVADRVLKLENGKLAAWDG